MRLCAFTLAIAHFLPVFASQVSLFNPTVSSTTLVDLLSADPDYSSLIRLLQRARLIPSLNRLNASSLFAPTNDAIERHASSNPLWNIALREDSKSPLKDNVQEELRQQLFYHILNYTLLDLPADKSPWSLETLLFPHKIPEHPKREPPPGSPWLPVPGGTLGGAPQRLRIAARKNDAYIGVDAFGNGGAKIVKPRQNATNGVVYGIADMLVPPPSLGHSEFSLSQGILLNP